MVMLLIATTVSAQQGDDDSQAARKRADFEAAADATRSEFNAYRDSVVQDYEKYEAQLKEEFDGYVRSIELVWGTDSALIDTPTRWVEYSKDFGSRSIVDFESGTVEIEIAVDETASEETVTQKMDEAVERLMISRGSTCPWASSVERSLPITQKPVLDGLLDLSLYHLQLDTTELSASPSPRSGRPVAPTPVRRGRDLSVAQSTEPAPRVRNKHLSQEREAARKAAANRLAARFDGSSISEIARQVVAQSVPKFTTVRGTDGTERKVVKVNMRMVTDNLSKSAALYRDIVAKYSQKYGIEQPLIFAIIEQESYFNPEATSHIPAYGLMQLVPRSGGADAYRYVYGKEGIPTRAFLFNPDNNICLGTAYLRILYNQFKKVNDSECQRLCVIASYNTGAGNVSRSFIGSSNLSRAFPNINALQYNALYDHLTTRLSTAEARNYVAGVSRRREKYMK